MDADALLQAIPAFFERMKALPYCYAFDAETLRSVFDSYGAMIQRMLDLNEES